MGILRDGSAALPILRSGTSFLYRNLVKPFAREALNTVMNTTPIGTAVRTVGPVVANWVGRDLFKAAMQRAGGFIDDHFRGTELRPLFEGQSLGDVFRDGTMAAFDYLKGINDGSTQSTASSGGGGGTTIPVERVQVGGGANPTNSIFSASGSGGGV